MTGHFTPFLWSILDLWVGTFHYILVLCIQLKRLLMNYCNKYGITELVLATV